MNYLKTWIGQLQMKEQRNIRNTIVVEGLFQSSNHAALAKTDREGMWVEEVEGSREGL